MNKHFVSLVFTAACSTEDSVKASEAVQEDNNSWPWCADSLPGDCQVGGAQSVAICRQICHDSGIPWFTSGCGNWEVPNVPPGTIGRCFMGPKP